MRGMVGVRPCPCSRRPLAVGVHVAAQKEEQRDDGIARRSTALTAAAMENEHGAPCRFSKYKAVLPAQPLAQEAVPNLAIRQRDATRHPTQRDVPPFGLDKKSRVPKDLRGILGSN